MLIDTHAHLYWDSYQHDFDQVVQRCLDNQVSTIINIGTNLETSQQSINLNSDLLNFYSTIGIHPHDAVGLDSDELIHQVLFELEGLYSQPQTAKIVALGECGLDYLFRDEFKDSLSQQQNKDIQMRLYKAQVELAKKHNLPVVIHCRDAWENIFIPELEGTAGVFHNFSGSKEDSQKALGLGYYLSFSCVITYPKNEALRELAKDLPLERILTETDCPFLPPQQIRGQRNEPSHIPEVIKVIAEVKSIPFDQVAAQVNENAHKLFKLT